MNYVVKFGLITSKQLHDFNNWWISLFWIMWTQYFVWSSVWN